MTTLTSESHETLAVDDLRELLRSVNDTTESLQRTHVALHGQVARLQKELAAANARLRRSRALAALGEMAAGIAHEIRNPLGSIQLYAQALADDLEDRPRQQELCGKIGRAISDLDAIVRDVLLFARDTEVRPVRLCAGDLVERSLAMCEALLQQGEVTVERRLGRDLEVVADPTLMGQALANVVRNAVEAMVEAGSRPRRLKLTSRKREVRRPDGRRVARVVLGVADSGPGIPAEARQRMFNPFFTTRPTGTGLGLAIVHRIVDAHGGHVDVRNLPAGGASVRIAVPAAAEETAT